MNGTLYRIFNLINGKSYIGKTYNDPYDRLAEHIRDSNRYQSRPLYRAFAKYGVDNFSFEILLHCEQGVLETREIEYIEKYNSYGKTGYNATLGGDGRRHINIEKASLAEAYDSVGTISGTSKLLSIDFGTCKKLLLDFNIPINPINIKQERRNRLSNKVLIDEVGLEFNNVYECATFLLEADIVESNISERNIGISIARACKHSRKYKGLSFSYIK